jgi:hypothetical protein
LPERIASDLELSFHRRLAIVVGKILGFRSLPNDVDVARTLVEVVTKNRPEHFQAAYTITVRQLGNLLSMGVYERVHGNISVGQFTSSNRAMLGANSGVPPRFCGLTRQFGPFGQLCTFRCSERRAAPAHRRP